MGNRDWSHVTSSHRNVFLHSRSARRRPCNFHSHIAICVNDHLLLLFALWVRFVQSNWLFRLFLPAATVTTVMDVCKCDNGPQNERIWAKFLRFRLIFFLFCFINSSVGCFRCLWLTATCATARWHSRNAPMKYPFSGTRDADLKYLVLCTLWGGIDCFCVFLANGNSSDEG